MTPLRGFAPTTRSELRSPRVTSRRLATGKVGLILSRFSPTSRKIAEGWRRVTAELGLETPGGLNTLLPDRGSPDFSDAVNAALDIALRAGVTGLLVHSDPEAMAFIDLALNRGISVPGDLSAGRIRR